MAKYLNDQWNEHILGDDFGLGRVGDQLARMILDVDPPFAIAVSGKWGSGKTSVMRRAFLTLGGLPYRQSSAVGSDRPEFANDLADKLRFDAADRVPTLALDATQVAIAKETIAVWYSPWANQGAATPLRPLLETIDAHFRLRAQSSKEWEKIGERPARWLQRALGSMVAPLAKAAALEPTTALVSAGAAASTAALAGVAADALRDGVKADAQAFHQEFEAAVERILEVTQWDDLARSVAVDERDNLKNARLVVFIDDLDRCEEGVAIQLLEAVKLHLQTRRCVFVFGMDMAAIQGACSRAWKDRSADAGREYLEKMFQAHVAVPPISLREAEAITKKGLEQNGFADFSTGEMAVVSRLVAGLLEPNPRKIKNFLNSLWALRQGSPYEDWEPEKLRKAVVQLYLRLYHPTVWRLIERQPWVFHLLVGLLISDHQLAVHALIEDDNFAALADAMDMRDVATITNALGFDEQAVDAILHVLHREFAHVLPTAEDAGVISSRADAVDLAVTALQDRIDQRRSDAVLRKELKNLYSATGGASYWRPEVELVPHD